ncbi:MAG: glutaredoxin family protein [Methanoregula sp.]|jgi:glutaredoxin-like protein NrdH|nr:glutaredoxin family protein [Methanoregula sp.]
MGIEHISGKDVGGVMLYALSTCQWCNKTKQLLKELGIGFDFVYLDLLEGNEQETALSDMEKCNPKGSFPTLVINDKRCIIGFQENQIREAFGT